MEVTIKIKDNPHFLKAVKQLAKAFNEPIRIKKQKSEFDKHLEEYYKSDEFLEALKEAEELEKAHLRGEIKGYTDVSEMMRDCLND